METAKPAGERQPTEYSMAFWTAAVRRLKQAMGQQNQQLRAQLARAKMERTVLKKALPIFSQPMGR